MTSIPCTKCHTPLPETFFNRAELAECPGCDTPIQVEVFRALFRGATQAQFGERIMVDGEASCFYHPQKRAVIPCGGCGRFLCALCDVELNDQHLCPACLETGRKKGKLTQLETKRTLYDSAALSLAIVPILVWPFTIVTAPIAVVLAVYSWFRPSSLVSRTRVRAYLALVFAFLQITGWVFLFTGLWSRLFRG